MRIAASYSDAANILFGENRRTLSSYPFTVSTQTTLKASQSVGRADAALIAMVTTSTGAPFAAGNAAFVDVASTSSAPTWEQ